MNKEKKEKKIVFTKEIDSVINGFALGISFLGIGIFLLVKPDYFFAPIISYILGAIIGAIGVLGIGVELSKTSKIRGMDNLAIGAVLFAIWVISYTKISAVWANVVFFIFLIFGAYAICLGFIQAVYSIISNAKSRVMVDDKPKHAIGALIGQVVLLITQICGLVIALLNVIQAVNV